MMTRTRRIVYVVLGAACVTVGAIGVVVPGLPTVVFLLAASWFFARSIPALDRRLREAPVLGEALTRFEKSRAMSPRTKGTAILSMWLGVSLGIYMTRELHVAFPFTLAAAAVVGTLFILLKVPTERALASGRASARGR